MNKKEKEPWVEKPEWQSLKEQGDRVIALQHVCTDACTFETCSIVREKRREEIRKTLEGVSI